MAPVFKTGKIYYATNYHPVLLTCICCKTIEHIKVGNINKHIAFESILADCQHGFRSQRSCETQLVQFYHDMVSDLGRALNRDQKQTDVIIMDFAKAFDKVPHMRLLYKLDYYGIEDLLTSGSAHGSLGALKKWCWLVKLQIQSWSYLVYHKDLSWGRSCFSFS